MGLLNLYDKACRRVDPLCDNCASNVYGRCAVIANGTSELTTLEHIPGRSFQVTDPIIHPGSSCAGKLAECGIEVDRLPFSPRTPFVLRSAFELILHVS